MRIEEAWYAVQIALLAGIRLVVGTSRQRTFIGTGMAPNLCFDRELNAFCDVAGDSADGGVVWVYRYKNRPAPSRAGK